MSITFTNPTSRIAIAARIAERQHSTPSHAKLMSFGERDFSDAPFTKDEARAEALKWVWQH